MKKIIDEINKAKSQNLDSLYLSGLGISDLPIEIRELKNLTYLNLEDNRLSDLPNWIGELENIESLKIDNNNISIIPDELGNLKKLSFFHFRNNNLSRLPNTMKDTLVRIIQKQQRIENVDGAGIKYIGVDGNRFRLSDMDTFNLDIKKLISILIPDANVEDIVEFLTE